MKFIAHLILLLSLVAGPSAVFAATAKTLPLRGGEGIPWPLGDKTPRDAWLFELGGEHYRVELRKDKYEEDQWSYNVRLVNLSRGIVVGKGLGVYNEENFYTFAIRDVEGRFYQFTSKGQGEQFVLNITIHSDYNMDIRKVRAVRVLTF